MSQRAYRRLQSEERRSLLLARATDLFAIHGYAGLSMSQLAREANISKALLYHDFPSKRRPSSRTSSRRAPKSCATASSRTRPNAGRAARGHTGRVSGVGAGAPGGLRQAAGERRLERGTGDRRRHARYDGDAILDGLGNDGEHPAIRATVNGWLGFLDGAILDAIAHGCDVGRQKLHGLLLGAFAARSWPGAGAALGG